MKGGKHPEQPSALERRRKFSDGQVAGMRQMLFEGASLGHVAGEYGTSREYVRKIKANRIRRGIGVDASGSVADAHKTRERARAFRANGHSVKEIAVLLDVGEASVYKACADMKLGNGNQGKRALARLWYAEGMTQAVIARQLQVAQQTISRWCDGLLRPCG